MIFKNNIADQNRTETEIIIIKMGNCFGSEEPESQVDVVSNNTEIRGKA